MADVHDRAAEKAAENGNGRNGNGEAVQVATFRAPLSAYMLKRLAHCADGHRTGKPLRIRMDSTAPFTAHEVIHEGCADPELCKGEEIVGPFLTYEDDDVLEKRRKVAKVVVHFDDGTVTEVHEADALFWSMSALEKFCFPWYSAQYGPKMAFRMWSQYANDKDMVVLCHDPRCEPCDVGGGGVQNVESMLGAKRLL